MTQRLEPTDPPAPPAPGEPGVTSEETVRRGNTSDDSAGRHAGEESYEPTDPHPDTPDDFDEDAAVGRESIESVPEEHEDED